MPTLLRLLLLFLAMAGSSVRAQDLISGRAYWDEPCARVSPAQLPLAEFRPYTGLLARGYNQCAVWLRLHIDPGVVAATAQPGTAAAGPSPDTLVLRIRPSYLDQIELFDPLQPHTPAPVTGDRQRPGSGEYESLALHFLVPRGDAPRDVFLRLQTTSTRLLEVQALPLMQAVGRDRVEELLYTAYLALLIVSLLVASQQWLQSRERVIGVFVFKQLVVLAWSLQLQGYGRALFGQLLAPAFLDGLTSLLVVSITATSMYFDRLLLREYHPPRWGMQLLMVLIALLPLELVLMLAGRSALALGLNAAASTVGVVVVFLMLLLARPGRSHEPPVLSRRLLCAFYGVIVLPVVYSMLTNLGWVPGNPLSLYALFVHGLLTGVIMVVFLAVRSRRLGLRQADAVAELCLVRLRMQQDRVYREDQEKLLGMLTHELKTPLSVVRMLLGTGQPTARQITHIQRALADMNDVIERCAQAGLLEGNRLQALEEACNLREELEDMAEQWQGTQKLALEVDATARVRGKGGTVVHTDPQLLRIVLANLIDNACKYSPPQSTVRAVLARRPDGGQEGLAITIANLPGTAGWPDPQQLFAKYYRSAHAHRQTGSGLGLYLVAGLAQLLRARVSYQPTGTHVCFRLWLPT